MKVGHFSDLHGNGSVLKALPVLPDIWVSTGDFFPNKTRGHTEIEPSFQREWFELNKKSIIETLGGKPIVSIDGNHDFVSLVDLLQEEDYPAFQANSKEIVMLNGTRFAGFREIPFIVGQWKGEVWESELRELSYKCLSLNPDILLTHTPPANICSEHYGSNALLAALQYGKHNIKFHLFGHDHDGVGVVEEMGIFFSNAATTFRLIETSTTGS